MHIGRRTSGLLAFVVACVAVACSRSDIDVDEGNGAGSQGNGQSASGSSGGPATGSGGSSSGGGSSGTTASSGAVGSSASGGFVGSSASGGFVGSSASGGFVGSSASGGFVGSSSSSSGSVGPCAPSLLEYPVVATFEPCWSCVEKGCAPALTACAQDCGCDQAIVSALACVNGGGTAISCFSPAIGGGDSVASALASCLVQAGDDCDCQESAPGGGDSGMPSSPPDASTGCVMTGGGGSAGNGSCSSTIEETCDGTDYQAVCACPQGRCVCFGPSTTIIEIGTCPYCPNSSLSSPSTLTPEDVLSMCGFPH